MILTAPPAPPEIQAALRRFKDALREVRALHATLDRACEDLAREIDAIDGRIEAIYDTHGRLAEVVALEEGRDAIQALLTRVRRERARVRSTLGYEEEDRECQPLRTS